MIRFTSFKETDLNSKQTEYVQNAKSVATGWEGVAIDAAGVEAPILTECVKTQPSTCFTQFVDANENKLLDIKTEMKLDIWAFFEGDPYGNYAFKPVSSDQGPVTMEMLRLQVLQDGLHSIELKDPMVAEGLPATHIRNLKVLDINGDGLLDIAFELVNAGSQKASLKAYLQVVE